MSSPFMGDHFKFKQPDGTEVELRGWGDQHYAVFETLDGYTVAKNPGNGFFEIAKVSDDGTLLETVPGPRGHLDGRSMGIRAGVRINREAARAQGMEGAFRMGGRRCDDRRRNRSNFIRAAALMEGPMMAPPQRDTTGDFTGLCLLIEFPDEKGTIPRDEVERFCNQKNYSGFGNNGSVRDYFFDNSGGRCRYTNLVAEYYEAQHPRSHYTDPNIQMGVRARQLIVEALTSLKAKGFDFSPLSVDAGGYAYALNVYYAGTRVNNWQEGLWPHAWQLGVPFELAPGMKAYDYQFTDMTHELTLGTFCHENGHMLCDYPDLYDYGGESSGVGAFCLMCSGGNIDKKNPAQISAYLKRLSGWSDSVTQIRHNEAVQLQAGKNEFAIFPKDIQEYFIIEHRARGGRDASLPGGGLAIWHVDERGDNSNEQMTPGQHYELSLEQADGNFTLEGRRYSYGDPTDLYGNVVKQFSGATTPNSNWWDGTASNLDIFDVALNGPTASFKVKLSNEEDSTTSIARKSTPSLDIPDNFPEGVVDTISIDEDKTIIGVQVTLDISHTYRGDLRVTLLPPWGDGVILHQRHQGGSENDIKEAYDEASLQPLADLHGHSTKGDWKLRIQDFAQLDEGTLNHWALEFTAVGESREDVVLQEKPGTHIPDNDFAGIERTLSTTAGGTVGTIEVSLDITHTYIGDLVVTLRSPKGTEVPLHNRTGGSADDIVKVFTTATTPDLARFEGENIQGDWRLHISDRVGADFGKLNEWSVKISPA